MVSISFDELNSGTLDTLSRLKGNETTSLSVIISSALDFGYAFPFEGN